MRLISNNTVLGRACGVRLKVHLHVEVDSVPFRPFIHLSLAAVSAWKVLEGGYGEVSGGANTAWTGTCSVTSIGT